MTGKNKMLASKALMLEMVQKYLDGKIINPVPKATGIYWNGSMFTIELEPRTKP